MSHRVVEVIRRANAPIPPETSPALRVVTAVAVFVGIAACQSVGELSPLPAVAAIVAVGFGMTFSYLTRNRQVPLVKPLLAIAVLVVFADYVLRLTSEAKAGTLTSVELPLAGLFVWVQVLHSVDVPARRDLLFSLAASAALMAVAGAQAIDEGFAVFVGLWLVSAVLAMSLSWTSIAGSPRRVPAATVGGSLLAVALLAAMVVTVLPAPTAERVFTLPDALTSYLSLPDPGGFAGGGSNPASPSSPGAPGGRVGVGGYEGFAGPLDLAVRGALGDQVVFRVRATLPGYFLGTTYDEWDGQSWKSSLGLRATRLTGGAPFSIPLPAGSPAGAKDVQTFYVAQPMANLIFATAYPTQVWFPDKQLFIGDDGSIRTGVAMTPGAVYTVVSADDQATPAEMEAAPDAVDRSGMSSYLALPANRYGRVRALAESITARSRTPYAKVIALEDWMAAHVRYSTDIPPLPAGVDAVDQFLFGTRVGYCEQISTALAVMLRTLGIPTREAIGYVPGPYDPLTDLYEVQAKDAHAWVQVWFPGVGWQSFDPTADVPLAPPDPGAVLLADAGHLAAGLPWQLIAPLLAAIVGEESLRRWRRRRPRSWAERVARRLEIAGAKAGTPRLPADGLRSYTSKLAGSPPAGLVSAVALLERTAYGGYQPAADEREAAAAEVSRFARAIKRARG